MEKKLGKIEKVVFGISGYQDSMIGLHVTLSGDGWGVCSCEHTAWDCNIIKCSERAKWTEDDRSKQYDEIVRYVSKLLFDSKVSSVDKLAGVPIEAEFDGFSLKSWRVLKEVL